MGPQEGWPWAKGLSATTGSRERKLLLTRGRLFGTKTFPEELKSESYGDRNFWKGEELFLRALPFAQGWSRAEPPRSCPL
jgi:hypothetical protein